MLVFILRRLAQAVVVMLSVAFIAFMLFQYVGDPVTNLLGQDATEEQRRSWSAMAAHNRWEARRSLGATGTPSLLELHVRGEAEPRVWLTPIPHNPIAPKLPRTLDPDKALILFSGAEAMVAHHAKLMGLADSVGEAIRTVQFPPLRSV